jgi:hypothetical protein
MKVALQSCGGSFVSAESGGGQELVVNRDTVGAWETFILIDRGGGNVALKAANYQYVSAVGGGGGALVASSNVVGLWETFALVDRGNNQVALMTSNGQYVSAENGGGGALIANRNDIGSWETFTRYVNPTQPFDSSLEIANQMSPDTPQSLDQLFEIFAAQAQVNPDFTSGPGLLASCNIPPLPAPDSASFDTLLLNKTLGPAPPVPAPPFDFEQATLQALANVAYFIPEVGVFAGFTAQELLSYYDYAQKHATTVLGAYDSSDEASNNPLSDIDAALKAVLETADADSSVTDLLSWAKRLQDYIQSLVGPPKRFSALMNRDFGAKVTLNPIGLDPSFIEGKSREDILERGHALGLVFDIIDSVDFSKLVYGDGLDSKVSSLGLAMNPTLAMYVNSSVISVVNTVIQGLFLYYHVSILPDAYFTGQRAQLADFNLDIALRARWNATTGDGRAASDCITLLRDNLDPDTGMWTALVDPVSGPSALAHQRIAKRLNTIELNYHQPAERDGLVFLQDDLIIQPPWQLTQSEVSEGSAAVYQRAVSVCEDDQTELVDSPSLSDAWASRYAKFSTRMTIHTQQPDLIAEGALTAGDIILGGIPLLISGLPKVWKVGPMDGVSLDFPGNPSDNTYPVGSYPQLCWSVGASYEVEQSYIAWRGLVLAQYCAAYNYTINVERERTSYAISQMNRQAWVCLHGMADHIVARATSVTTT